MDANKWLLPPLCLCLCWCHATNCCRRGARQEEHEQEMPFWDLSIGAGHAQCGTAKSPLPCCLAASLPCCLLPDISKETPFDVDTIIASGDRRGMRVKKYLLRVQNVPVLRAKRFITFLYAASALYNATHNDDAFHLALTLTLTRSLCVCVFFYTCVCLCVTPFLKRFETWKSH